MTLLAVSSLALLGAVGCGGSGRVDPASVVASAPPAAAVFAGAAVLPPRPAAPIVLEDAGGRTVTLAGQRGRFVLVTFLYTHCPDICPLIAANLNAALRALGPAHTDVRVLAVSVDPAGDTRAAVRAYEKRLRLVPEFRYLIGTRADLRRVWAAWHVLTVRNKPDLVDHVAYTALVDRTGKMRVLYDSRVRARQVLHDLRRLMRSA
jgi:protein SCO1/2